MKTSALLASRQDPEGSFVTAYLLVIDLDTGSLRYAGAGHPPAVMRRSDGNVESLHLGQMPLGVMPAQQFTEQKDCLKPGDEIVLYTDGISEARHDSELLEVAGVERVLDECGDNRANVVARSLVDGALAWSHGNSRDDAAVVVVKRNQ